MQLLLTEKVMFGSPVVVQADSKAAHIVKNITIPSLEEGEVKCCSISKITLKEWLQRNVTEYLLLPFFQFAP